MVYKMINPFKLKKWGALIISSIIPSLFFILVLTSMNNIIWAVGGMILGMLLSVLIGSSLLKNPFSDMLEGKGLLVFNLTSTGIIQAFVMPFEKNFLTGYINGEVVEEYFDRDGTNVINAPKKTKSRVAKTKDGGLLFEINGDELNDARFAFNQYPLLFYNQMSNTFFSKEQLAEFEKKIISYNKLVFLSKKVEDLTMYVKNFGRHIVESLKPKKVIGGMPSWVILLFVIIIIVIVVMMILKSGGGNALSGAFSSASSSLGGGGSAVITPK
jgi:hypothetical protein